MIKYETIDTVDKGCIYLLTSPSGKYYIGQSWDVINRWKRYKKLWKNVENQRALWSALNKYGPENFIYEIIYASHDQSELNEKEIFFINFFESTNKNKGYNIRSGGSNGKLSEETKKLISLNAHDQRGTKNNMWGKFGNKNPNYGRKLFQEQKDFISKTNKGRKRTGRQLEEGLKIKLAYFRNKKWEFIYILTDQNGKTLYMKNYCKFCKDNNIRAAGLSLVLTGKKDNYKGWKIRKEKINSEFSELAIDKDLFPN